MIACGVMVSKKAPSVPRALVGLHELPKDTLDDVRANRCELAETDGNGSFRFVGLPPIASIGLLLKTPIGARG